MRNKIIKIFSVFFIMNVALAAPKQIEVVFLSANKVGDLSPLIKKLLNPFVNIQLYTQNDHLDCLPMGGTEGCFHPQLGFIKDYKLPMKKDEKVETKKQLGAELKTINNYEVNLVNCDDGNYFDIFCGKARKEAKPSGHELWIDTSSSMKRVDWGEDEFCGRRRLAAKIQNTCPGKISISTFDTAKKTMGSLANTCINYGLNDSNRIVDWVKASNAEYLLIITDTDEYKNEFREYLDEVNAVVHGIGVKTNTQDELISLTKNFKNVCK